MRMLVNVFTMMIAALLPTTVLAQQPSQPNAAPTVNPSAKPQATQQAVQQPAATTQPVNVQAVNQQVTPKPAEEVLLPGSQILAGNPDKNEFFIVGKNEPTPPALIEERKLAEERVRPTQVALDETKKTIQEMKVPKLEKAFGAKPQTLNAQAQTSEAAATAIKQAPIALQAENEVNPQVSQVLAAPVLTDATTASSVATQPVKKAEKKPLAKKTTTPEVKPVAKTAMDKKAGIKHVFNAPPTKAALKVAHESKSTSAKKNVAAATPTKQPALPKVKPVDVKALLAKVEVVKAPKVSKSAVHQPITAVSKPATVKPVATKPAAHKQAAANTKKVHLSLAKTTEEVKHGHVKFKVKAIKVD